MEFVFSDVSKSYLKNAEYLDKAREEFEKQSKEFMEEVKSMLRIYEDRVGRTVNNADESFDSKLYFWRGVDDNWTDGFKGIKYQSYAILQLRCKNDLSNPRSKSKVAGDLKFEIYFHKKKGEFVLKVSFSNSGNFELFSGIETKIFDLLKSENYKELLQDSAAYDGTEMVLSISKLDDKLCRDIGIIVKKSIEVCVTAVEELISLKMPATDNGLIQGHQSEAA